MLVTVTLNPSLDRLIYVKNLLPNDTNRILAIEEDAGGKGVNVARVFNRLEGEVTATGFLGGRAGSYVARVLEDEGVNCDFTRIALDTRTNWAIQEEDGSPPTALNSPGPEILPDELEDFTRKLETLSKKSSYVAFCGSVPRGVPKDIYQTLTKTVVQNGCKVVLDADEDALRHGIQSQPYLVKPNEYEASRLLGQPVQTIEQAAQAARKIHQMGVEYVIVSMGADGAVAASAEAVVLAVPPRVTTVSTIGSGDSMVAGFLSVMLKQGGDLDEAMRWGTAAGAATAMTDGSDIGNAAQIRELLDRVEIRFL